MDDQLKIVLEPPASNTQDSAEVLSLMRSVSPDPGSGEFSGNTPVVSLGNVLFSLLKQKSSFFQGT